MTRATGRATPDQDNSTAHLILAASATVFARKGYTDTTIADLATAAEVSRPTVYAHFGAKVDVFRALAHRIRDEFENVQTRSGEPGPGPFVADALAAYLDVYVRYLGALTVLKHQALTDPEMAGIWDDIHTKARRRHTRFIKTLTTAGQATPHLPPDAVSDVLIGVVTRFAEIVARSPRRRREMLRNLNAVYEQLTGITASAP